MLVHDPYYDVKAVSNSSLKHINPQEGGSARLFKQHWDDKAPTLRTSSLEFGNLLHLAVLEPHLLEYQVDKSNTPDKIRDILKDLYAQTLESDDIAASIVGEEVKVGPIEDYAYSIISMCDKHAYGRTWKTETRMNKILSSGYEYWDMLRNSDKFIITQAQCDLMHTCLESIRSNPSVQKALFGESMDIWKGDEWEAFNELEVHWEEPTFSFPLKGKIDRLQINHTNNTFQVVDLKTTSKALGQFHESFEHYRYYRQVAFYEEAARRWLAQRYPGVNYEGRNHMICAVETKNLNQCKAFTVSRETVERGNAEMYDLLFRLDYHFKNDTWNNDLETLKNQRVYL